MFIPCENLLLEGLKITFGAILGALIPGFSKILAETINRPKVEAALLRCRKQNDALEVSFCIRNFGKKACSLEIIQLVDTELNKHCAHNLEKGGFMPPVHISSNSSLVVDVIFDGISNDPQSAVLAFNHNKYVEIEIEENIVNKNLFKKNSILEAIAIIKDEVKPKFYGEKIHASIKNM